MSPWWSQPAATVLKHLSARKSGLTLREVAARQQEFGPNSLPEEAEPGLVSKIVDAFSDRLVIVLSSAATISAAIGIWHQQTAELQQAGLIFGIVLFMVLVEYVTDQKASTELKKLTELQKTYTRVQRDGVVVEVAADQLVPGDILLLQTGDKIPADARVIQADDCLLNESVLTGEPVPVPKNPEPVADTAELADRTNMVFAGTFVAAGTATAVVVGTGVKTELGSIWQELQQADESLTPLQQQLDRLGNFLLWGTLAVCLLVVGLYLFQGFGVLDAVIVAVSLAIAFIPESLGVVIRISLALGVNEMVKEGAIIKRLLAAEGLGSINVVCTDKTGTITEGRMKATQLWTVTGRAQPVEDLSGIKMNSVTHRLVSIAQFCNNLQNPTEQALAELANLVGLELTADTRSNRVVEIPFSSDRKMMTVGHQHDGESILLRTKGAPDRLVDRCTTYAAATSQTGVTKLTPKVRQEIHQAVEALEGQGYRVLAFADRVISMDVSNQAAEAEFTFVGLIALFDPPRKEVSATVSILSAAGISAKMITGDSPRTALTIAKQTKMLPPAADLSQVITGSQLEKLLKDYPDPHHIPADELRKITQTQVFARTTPSQKIWLVRAFQVGGHMVAMTGDGVNDAPSIKQANVGIAMQAGTDIAKDTADVILTASYQAISSAVKVGRTILHRTRLYTHALLSTNGAEVITFLVAALAGWSAPFTAIQLLLINLLGDSWLSIALATEPAEDDVLAQPPRDPKESIITPYMYFSILVQSLVATGILVLSWIVTSGESLILQQSVLFAVFMVQKILRSSFTARSLTRSIWELGLISNPWTLLAGVVTAVMAVVALYIPIFEMTMIPSQYWWVLALGLLPPALEELLKAAKVPVLFATKRS